MGVSSLSCHQAYRRGSLSRFSSAGKESDDAITERVIRGMLNYGHTRPGPRYGHNDLFLYLGFRPGTHQEDPVGEQDGFINVMGHHEYGDACFLPHSDELILDDPAGECVYLSKRFI